MELFVKFEQRNDESNRMHMFNVLRIIDIGPLLFRLFENQNTDLFRNNIASLTFINWLVFHVEQYHNDNG